jgi:cadmium resistance protein CadD (predicted permease)
MFSEYALALALLAFFSTAVDDFCVLLIFFSTEYGKYPDGLNDPKCQSAFVSISIGQFVGFTIIVALSLAIGVGLSQTVDEDYIDLIGFIPILIGLYQIYELLVEAKYVKPCCTCCSTEEEKIEEETTTANEEQQPLISSSEEKKDATPNASDGSDGEHSPHPKKRVSIREPDGDLDRVQRRLSISAHGLSTSAHGDLEAMGEGGTWRDHDPATRPRRRLSEELNSKYFESLNKEIDVTEAMLETYTADRAKGAKGQVVGSWFMCFMDPLAFEVMIYSLIFGIDNLAIYTVLFGKSTMPVF